MTASGPVARGTLFREPWFFTPRNAPTEARFRSIC